MELGQARLRLSPPNGPAKTNTSSDSATPGLQQLARNHCMDIGITGIGGPFMNMFFNVHYPSFRAFPFEIHIHLSSSQR